MIAGSDTPASISAQRASISRSFSKMIPSMSGAHRRPGLAAQALAAAAFLAAGWPYLRLKRSTRPAVSISFCFPVKKGWQLEQISTRISFFVDRVSGGAAGAVGHDRIVVGMNVSLHGYSSLRRISFKYTSNNPIILPVKTFLLNKTAWISCRIAKTRFRPPVAR